MIKSFRHRGVEDFFSTGSKKGIQPKHAAKLQLRLAVLNEAKGPDAMNLPGYNLHLFKGDMAGHWPVKVDGNWRLTFMFEGEDAVLVDYQDYHLKEKTMASMHNPSHPGAVLREALNELPITVTDFAEHIGVARSTVTRILAEDMGISPDMSVRLSEAFGQKQPDLWLRMQVAYDIWHASRTNHKIKPLTSHTAG